MTLRNENPLNALSSYELRFIAVHLMEAGQARELHRLLALPTGDRQNATFAARYGLGDAEGYASDVTLAWRAAEQTSRDTIHAAGTAGGMSQVVRYSLVMSSMNSLASSIPPWLLGPLVRAGIWTIEQSLAFAYRYVEW